MKNCILCLIFFLLALNEIHIAHAQEGEADLMERVKMLEDKLSERNRFDAYWKDGLRLETTDGDFLFFGKVAYTFANDWQASVQAKNLLDEEYWSPPESEPISGGVPNRGREILVEIVWRY